MLALALVFIPVSSALAAVVTVTAVPAVVSFTATPDWTINGIAGSGSIWPNTTYYANNAGDRTPPDATVADDDCYFTFTNAGAVPIAITCDMSDFSGGTNNMTNGELGYTLNGATAFGASGYASGDTWPGMAVIFMKTGSALFIASLGENGAPDDTIMWGVALITQQNDFTDVAPSTSTITCTASEP